MMRQKTERLWGIVVGTADFFDMAVRIAFFTYVCIYYTDLFDAQATTVALGYCNNDYLYCGVKYSSSSSSFANWSILANCSTFFSPGADGFLWIHSRICPEAFQMKYAAFDSCLPCQDYIPDPEDEDDDPYFDNDWYVCDLSQITRRCVCRWNETFEQENEEIFKPCWLVPAPVLSLALFVMWAAWTFFFLIVIYSCQQAKDDYLGERARAFRVPFFFFGTWDNFDKRNYWAALFITIIFYLFLQCIQMSVAVFFLKGDDKTAGIGLGIFGLVVTSITILINLIEFVRGCFACTRTTYDMNHTNPASSIERNLNNNNKPSTTNPYNNKPTKLEKRREAALAEDQVRKNLFKTAKGTLSANNINNRNNNNHNNNNNAQSRLNELEKQMAMLEKRRLEIQRNKKNPSFDHDEFERKKKEAVIEKLQAQVQQLQNQQAEISQVQRKRLTYSDSDRSKEERKNELSTLRKLEEQKQRLERRIMQLQHETGNFASDEIDESNLAVQEKLIAMRQRVLERGSLRTSQDERIKAKLAAIEGNDNENTNTNTNTNTNEVPESVLPPFYDSQEFPKKEKTGAIGKQEVNEDSDDNEPDKDPDLECKICFDKLITTVLVPCGHACVCRKCAKELVKSGQSCPLCKAPIQNVQKFYLG